MTQVQKAAAALIKAHGSLRKAGRATGINYAYLHRLASGEKVNPKAKVLEILGIERKNEIYRKRTPHAHPGLERR